jgi:hypothetical protein
MNFLLDKSVKSLNLLSESYNSDSDSDSLSDSLSELSIDSSNELEFRVTKKIRKNFSFCKERSKLYLERDFDIYSLNHSIINYIDTNNIYNIGILCSVKLDRLPILIQNIIKWLRLGFNVYLFFSELSVHDNVKYFIENIKENEEISNNFENINYVIYSYSSYMLEDSAGVARVSALLFFNKYFERYNRNSIFIISDDRRLTKFGENEIIENRLFSKMIAEEISDNIILFPQSQRSASIKNKKTFGKKQSKKLTTYHSSKLGQVYIMNICTIKNLCSNHKILNCMSAPIFEDYVLQYFNDFQIKISKYCNRYSIGYQESIARKNISNEEIYFLLTGYSSKGYFLNIVLDIIIQYDIKIYNGEGYKLHKKILDIYL